MLDRNWLVLRMSLPDWSAAAIVGVSVALALGVLVAMLLPFGRGVRPAARVVGAGDDSTRPGLDIVLLISTLAIVGLAIAVYLTRP